MRDQAHSTANDDEPSVKRDLERDLLGAIETYYDLL